MNPGAVTLLHSGIVYPSERDPTQLMAALQLLHQAGVVRPGQFKLRFRAAVAEDLLRDKAAEFGVTEYVEVCPPIPYREALAEMLRADALVLMQASNCNAQIPAKLYEYLRADRPLLCLADPAGDTARAVLAAGVDTVVPLDDAHTISKLIGRFLQAPHLLCSRPSRTRALAASRQARAVELSQLLASL